MPSKHGSVWTPVTGVNSVMNSSVQSEPGGNLLSEAYRFIQSAGMHCSDTERLSLNTRSGLSIEGKTYGASTTGIAHYRAELGKPQFSAIKFSGHTFF